MTAKNSDWAGMPPATTGKTTKPRRPYKMTRPREKWAADEHERFLHGLMLFGRDWKSIEKFLATKTTTQIRSHAQFFLKAQKLGLGEALPPPHPRRGAAIAANAPCSSSHPDHNAAAAGMAAAPMWPTSATPPVSSMDLEASSGGARQSAGDSAAAAHRYLPSCCCGGGGRPSDAVAGAVAQEDETIQLPLSPDDPRFAEVYRFVGDVFGSGAARPVEEQLRRLHDQGVDPAVVDTRLTLTRAFFASSDGQILLVLRNLQDNLFA